MLQVQLQGSKTKIKCIQHSVNSYLLNDFRILSAIPFLSWTFSLTPWWNFHSQPYSNQNNNNSSKVICVLKAYFLNLCRYLTVLHPISRAEPHRSVLVLHYLNISPLSRHIRTQILSNETKTTRRNCLENLP